jgi:hypothetical protein
MRASQSLDAEELGKAEVSTLNGFQQSMEENEEQETDPILKCLAWLMRAPKKPPKPWETYRREEIASYMQDTKDGLMAISYLIPDTLLYRLKRRRWLRYYGEKNDKRLWDGRGVAFWPDPPFGGGGERLLLRDRGSGVDSN